VTNIYGLSETPHMCTHTHASSHTHTLTAAIMAGHSRLGNNADTPSATLCFSRLSSHK